MLSEEKAILRSLRNMANKAGSQGRRVVLKPEVLSHIIERKTRKHIGCKNYEMINGFFLMKCKNLRFSDTRDEKSK